MNRARIFRWSRTALTLVALAFLASSLGIRSELGGSFMEQLTGSFRDETAQTRFMSYATTITPLSRFEVAKLDQIEVFDRTSQETLFWKRLGLPEVVVRATIPVEYRYYVQLGNTWQVELKDRVLTVTAPTLEAGTPSANISELRFEVRKGSLFRSESSVANALRLELTRRLELRAQENLPLVRETARQQVGELAKKWLGSESRDAAVVVHFADEATPLQTK